MCEDRGVCDIALSEAYDIDNPHELGRLGEEIAARFLEQQGFGILERNWRCLCGEADIVAAQDAETVLIEVKTRLGAEADPLESVVGHKQAVYRKVGLAYLMAHDEAPAVRFDVIGINVTRPGCARLRHLMGVYSWDS